jgi:hypothetical protein
LNAIIGCLFVSVKFAAKTVLMMQLLMLNAPSGWLKLKSSKQDVFTCLNKQHASNLELLDYILSL